MSTPTLIGIASIAIGFLCIAGAFAAYMYKKPVGISIGLGVLAFFCVTVIPVFLAVFYATTPV